MAKSCDNLLQGSTIDPRGEVPCRVKSRYRCRSQNGVLPYHTGNNGGKHNALFDSDPDFFHIRLGTAIVDLEPTLAIGQQDNVLAQSYSPRQFPSNTVIGKVHYMIFSTGHFF
jgi:hypothetical protein